MNVRKYSAGLAASALLASGIALTAAAPALADPSFVPTATDIVGAGSDTIEGVVTDLANGKTIDGVLVPGWNATHASQRIASFDATPQPSTIVLRDGAAAVSRPNGSGQGKARLFGAGNDVNVNFARSSSTLSSAEQAELTQYPFAVDGLKIAVSGLTPSNAPVSLTTAQVVGIYKGTYKKWNDIDPSYSSDFIRPFIPQSGSGTRSFFEAELKAANEGVTVVYPGASGGYLGVQETQEHSPNDIQGNPNALVPFSTARAQTLANQSAIRLEGGYSAKRAVYNVVRNADNAQTWVTGIFGSAGFFCSEAAKPIIEANGFAQLASTANGGVCGQGTTTATSNFTTNTVTTTTTLTATAPAGKAVKLTAVVAADGQAADGDVDFFEGGTKVGSGLLTGGQAVLNLSNVTPGVHTYTAAFKTANPASFTDSESSAAQVTVKDVSTATVVVVPTSYGRTGTVTVTVASGSGSTGNVTAKVGTLNLGTKATAAGKAVFTLPANLAAGTRSVTATYAGNAEVAGVTATKAFNRAKAKVTITESFPATVAKKKKAVGTVTIKLSPASGLKPTGLVTIKLGTKVVGKGTLTSAGTVKITLSALTKGTKTLSIVYGGSANVTAKTQTFKVVQK